MTEYVVLLIGDDERWWTESSAEVRAQGYAAHGKFSEQLGERGHRITGGAELHRSSQARTIAPNATTVTDGPWTESAEQIGGYYVVETDDLDDLLQCCLVLAATGDAVEVRRCVQPDERAS